MAKRVTKGNLWGFIQSRPYASVADIRRLFSMDVHDAALVPTSEGIYYIGLPQDAADLIRQLWHEGRIVLDTNPDVKARVVQGVYPARAPAGRQQSAQGGSRATHAPAQPASGAQRADAADATGVEDDEQAPAKRRRRRRRRGGAGNGNGNGNGNGGGAGEEHAAAVAAT